MIAFEPSQHPLVDIGANLTHASFADDFEQVVQRAQQANVRWMVVTGSDFEESRAAIELARLRPDIFLATAGIHPHYAELYNANTHPLLVDLVSDPKVCAIGETGLDFFRDISARDVQQQSFSAHLQLAEKYGKPVFLHQRDAHETFLAILKEHMATLPNAVVHCFTDTAEALHDYIDLGCHIGITGWICDERRGAHLLDCVADIPLERLMIETDAPYLLPRSIKPKPRTRRNEPCTLPHILTTIAGVRSESEAELATATTRNAMAFFNIDNKLPAV